MISVVQHTGYFLNKLQLQIDEAPDSNNLIAIVLFCNKVSSAAEELMFCRSIENSATPSE